MTVFLGGFVSVNESAKTLYIQTYSNEALNIEYEMFSGKLRTLKHILTRCRNTKMCRVFVIPRKMSLFLCKVSNRRIQCFDIKQRKKFHYRGKKPMSEKRKNMHKREDWKGKIFNHLI